MIHSRARASRSEPDELQLVLVQLEAEGHVLEHGAVRERAVLLEDHPAVAPGAVDLPPAHEDLAGGRRVHVREAVDQVEDRGLAAARGADDRDELAVVGDVVDRGS